MRGKKKKEYTNKLTRIFVCLDTHTKKIKNKFNLVRISFQRNIKLMAKKSFVSIINRNLELSIDM
jgi:hypothetical protein